METSPEESRVLSYLADHEAELLALVGELIAAPSENPPGDERKVAEVIVAQLRALGLPEPEVVGPDPRRRNVICRLRGGRPGPTLMYNGHIDTKPVGDRASWRTDPFVPTLIEGQLHGLGACDMKGAVAAMIYAAAALSRDRGDLAGDLLLAFSADEEAGGSHGARYLVEEYGIRAEAALIGEPSGIFGDWESFCAGSRGVCCFKIRVYGTQMHSAISDVVPCVNASVKMAGVLSRMPGELSFRHEPTPLCPQGPTLCPGVMVSGGVFYGINPGYAEFSSDVRVMPGMTLEGVKEDVEAFLDQLRAEDPELKVELEVEAMPLGWREPLGIEPEHSLAQAALSAGETVLGRRPPVSLFPAWTDSMWLQGLGKIPTVPAFGPGLLPLAHQPNEHVSVEAVAQAARIYALTALRYLR